MRRVGLAALLLWQGAAAKVAAAPAESLRFARMLATSGAAGQTCAVLDANVFAHSATALRDLRLFDEGGGLPAREVPYVVTVSRTATDETEVAPALNVRAHYDGRSTKLDFDLRMPSRPYSDVQLELAAYDFVAQATVFGEDTPGTAASARTPLGTFTLFDLSAQHLSRDTTLPLAESQFPFLHVELRLRPIPEAPGGSASSPDTVLAAQVPPSRTDQMLYTRIAETSALTSGNTTRATFELSPHVPVERITFVPVIGSHGSFSREVRITATPDHNTGSSEESLSGTILRVHTRPAGTPINADRLSIPAILGANLQTTAKVMVTIENGDQGPPPIAGVRLEMRQRRLCFEAEPLPSGQITLRYGDPSLPEPTYEYQRLFRPAAKPLLATLGPELPSPTFHPQTPTRTVPAERRREVLWLAPIAVVCLLGIAVRRTRKGSAN